jgi:hypothetical protein
MSTPPRRRWFQFSLRTMFVVVALAAVPLGWASRQYEIARERQEFADRIVRSMGLHGVLYVYEPEWKHWLFGDGTVLLLGLPAESTDDDLAEACRLFPEAGIVKDGREYRGWKKPPNGSAP